jgi:hypothetical protein
MTCWARGKLRGHEPLRQTLWQRTPKYGNDDDYADDVMRSVFEAYFQAVDARPNTKGGRYRVNLLPTTVHVYFGSVMGATPDGRKAGLPLSEGISPVQGADRQGPTRCSTAADGPRHRRDAAEHEVQPPSPGGRRRLENLMHLIRSLRLTATNPVQRRGRRDSAQGPGQARGVPEPDRPRRRIQRLLRRLQPRPPKRDHRPHRAEGR